MKFKNIQIFEKWIRAWKSLMEYITRKKIAAKWIAFWLFDFFTHAGEEQRHDSHIAWQTR